MNLNTLQREQHHWSAKNFGTQRRHQPLLGIVEEVGELSHAFLKSEQGIRTNEDHRAKMIDAVGDIVIYLAGFCSVIGIDFEKAVSDTWLEVSKRDWTKNSKNGEVADQAQTI